MWTIPTAQVATHGGRSRLGDQAPTVGRRQSGDQRSSTGRESRPGPVGQFPFFLKFFFFLPSTFCASGQLLLVGSNTCLPCPDFSLKLQTPITFDP
jgi:hypothetical protein